MAKLNMNDNAGIQNGEASGKAEKILTLVNTAVTDLKALSQSVEKVTSSVDKRKRTEAENTVKVMRAETDAKKEDYRHDEAMANIELKQKNLAEASANGELKISMIRDMVQMIKLDYDRLTNMDDTAFLSEESRIIRDRLHNTILELSKEILHA